MESNLFRAPGLILLTAFWNTQVLAEASASPAAAEAGWFAFRPKPDSFGRDSAIDLRFLNERFAGEQGYIGVQDGQFIHTTTGEPVRFWAVNGPPHHLTGAELRRCARALAKRGVNLVRVHGRLFDKSGEPDLDRVRHAVEVVEALKAEGIYTHFSIYFPLWFAPAADLPWLEGYDGRKFPFGALMFNEAFQEKYRAWWKSLLTTPGPKSGKTLAAEPAVFGVEIQNEDSLFFWTFAEDRIPEAQWRILEGRFGDWLIRRHGSLEAALAKWKGQKAKRDNLAEGRVGFRPLWNVFNERSARDQETAEFLYEVQRTFYEATYAFLRQLGFRGVITASNWATASPEVFGPLEKWSYTAGDFIDRHGYFSCNHKGENAEWSLRNEHTYNDRSALRFEAEEPGKAKQFVHPVMDPAYDGKPSMISETTFTRPNRHRSEAPLYYAAYGALQGTDAIVHFALDSGTWAVKPGFWMQPWTLFSPAMMGQFPAAALVFRRGLIAPGKVLAEVHLNTADLLCLRGTPLPQDASFDELRLKDIPPGGEWTPGQRLDPLLHYAGQALVRFTKEPGSLRVEDLRPWIDRAAQTVSSSTGELKLDYGKGVLQINAPKVQGLSGNLRAAGAVQLRDLTLSSGLDLGHLLAVSLDDRPLADSRRILLQVMSEEKASGFQTEPAGTNTHKILSIGRDPWLVKELDGVARFQRPDAAQLRVTRLDPNGYPAGKHGTAAEIRLQPDTLYYLISR